MPLCKQELVDETKFLSEIEKVQDVIRKKYKLLKMGKENISETANEYLKPVVTPLNKLAAQLTTTNKPTTNVADDDDDDELFSNKENTNDKINNSIHENDYSTSDNEQSIYEQEGEYDTADEGEETFVEESNKNILDNYLEKINSIQWDKEYGIKKVKSDYKIGNAKIFFNDDELNIFDTTYKITPGLLELLFMKSPDKRSITDIDEKNYYEIINNTNAHHQYHRSSMPIKNPASRKYINFIAPHNSNNKHNGTGLLPTVMTLRKNNPSRVNYIFWDDPNELVERLRLLVASRAAGNPNHDNEIMSIIEELRESGLIY